MNGDRFVEERLASLGTGEDIMIDPGRILARLQVREQARRKTQIRMIGGGIFAAVACGALATVVTVQRKPVVAPPPVVAAEPDKALFEPLHVAPKLMAENNKPPHTMVLSESFGLQSFIVKQTGSQDAPIALEIYIDFECPPCAAFYKQTIPLLISEYVDTGKVKIRYRDFPLPQHQYAERAARYANAAALIGKYDVVSAQIIATQDAWRKDGSVEAQVAAVLSPEDMQKVRDMLEKNTEPDESIAQDRLAAAKDDVNQTPSVVVVANGTRRKISGSNTLPDLRRELDSLLARQ